LAIDTSFQYPHQAKRREGARFFWFAYHAQAHTRDLHFGRLSKVFVVIGNLKDAGMKTGERCVGRVRIEMNTRHARAMQGQGQMTKLILGLNREG
jgi:hypothetical protein